MSGDILKEVPEDELPRVLEEMKKDWPTNFLLCQYITMMEEYRKESKPIAQILYRHGSFDNGVYILKTIFVGQSAVFIGTTSTDLSEISRVLVESTQILLSDKIFFEINFTKFTPYVTQALSSKGLKYTMTNNIMMWLPPEDKLDVGVVPEGIYLGSLEESHIPEINENWPFKSQGSVSFLSLELQVNYGLGLFRMSDKKLLSSSMTLHSGGIFILYTHQEHRRKGYAEIIVRSMAQEIRKRGRIPFGTIIDNNVSSLNLFKKIGFKEFSVVNFITVL